ncbi:MAG: DUF6675 family protein [Geminicoccaceae bacterium]
MRRWTGMGLAALIGLPLATAAADAMPPPVPPCAGRPVPVWPMASQPPVATVWHADALPASWQPPACTGLEARPGNVVTALAGSFHAPGGIAEVTKRLGALSQQRQIRYWDVSSGQWVAMLNDAAALDGTAADGRRADFAAAEFRTGVTLHVLYADSNPISPVVYETTVLAAEPAALRLVTRNITPAKMMGFTVASPGDLASMVQIEAAGSDLINYYALTTVTLGSLAAALVPDAAHINRAAATFRFVAGAPTDGAQPLATQ